MDLQQAREILQFAKQAKMCEVSYSMAEKFLLVEDLEGFETVCRAEHKFLQENNIPYILTDGLGCSWHKNGQKCAEYTFKDGKLDGSYHLWHKNGQKDELYTFKDGLPTGRYCSWDKRGKLEAERFL